jgi:hypothetical protein
VPTDRTAESAPTAHGTPPSLLEIWTALLLPADGAELLEHTLNRLLTDDYQVRINGTVLDRNAAAGSIARAREQASGGRIELIEELHDGDRLAARLVFHFRAPDGTENALEAYMLGRLAPDGRLARLAEVLHPLDSSAQQDLLR